MTETTALAQVCQLVGIEVRDRRVTVTQPVGLKRLAALDCLTRKGWTVTFRTPRPELIPTWQRL